MVWQKLGTTTNTGAADPITISDMIPKIFNQSMAHLLISGGGVNDSIRYGNSTVDSGNNYAVRESNKGATDVTYLSQPQLRVNVPLGDEFHIVYWMNISTEEKLVLVHSMSQEAVGAATAPDRTETAAKWVNTSNQADIIQFFDFGAVGTFNIDSNLSSLGTD